LTNDPTPGPDPHAIEGGFFAGEPTADRTGPVWQMADLEARYRGLIDHLPAVLYIDGVDKDGPMVDIGPGIESLLGIPREEWLASSSTWYESVHPEDRERVVAASDASVETGEPFRVEYRSDHRDGRVLWIREEAVLIHDADHEPLYWLGIMLDVTEQVDTQRDLHHLRSTYGALKT
jgi:PAS domain S-box-containing protein